jgi:Helicase associated domain
MLLLLLCRRQHRLGGGQRQVGAATATWWLFLSIIVFEVLVPFWCCDGYSFHLPLLSPSRFTTARHNPNRLQLSVQPPKPDNHTGKKPYYATAKENETENQRLSLRTESNAKQWNATSTADDNDLYKLVNYSSKQSHRAKEWNAMFEKLQEYKTVHGDCLVPQTYRCDDGTTLGAWVQRQRCVRNTSEGGKRRGEWRRQVLDSIGFVWIVSERGRQLSPENGQYALAGERFNARWNAMFEKLKEYKKVHGDCLVHSKYKCDDGTRLGQWVQVQRRSPRYTSDDGKRRCEQRRQALDSIGFVWIVKERLRQLSPETGQYASRTESFNARWNARFEQLKEYKKVHGHCQVPKSYECADGSKLGVWVSAQRCVGISDSEMNPMRRQALDDISFVWQVREPSYTLDERWNDMFQLLQEYQAAHGDCLVQKDYVTEDKKPLGTWVRQQRQALTSGTMFRDLYKDRLQKLQSIGFVLRALPDDSLISQWDRNFEQLVEYQRQHGNCLVPKEYAGDLALGEWVKDQRKNHHTMDPERIQQLDSIGFVWDGRGHR